MQKASHASTSTIARGRMRFAATTTRTWCDVKRREVEKGKSPCMEERSCSSASLCSQGLISKEKVRDPNLARPPISRFPLRSSRTPRSQPGSDFVRVLIDTSPPRTSSLNWLFWISQNTHVENSRIKSNPRPKISWVLLLCLSAPKFPRQTGVR